MVSLKAEPPAQLFCPRIPGGRDDGAGSGERTPCQGAEILLLGLRGNWMQSQEIREPSPVKFQKTPKLREFWRFLFFEVKKN